MEQEIIQGRLTVVLPKTSLTIISKGRVANIAFDEITHITRLENDTIIYTGTGIYKTGYSLQELLSELPVNEFYRVHRSHIVSLKWVNGIKRNKIVVGDFYVPVSKYYKVMLLARMKEKLDREYFFYQENTSEIYERRL